MLASLQEQGFAVIDGAIVSSAGRDKAQVRALHAAAVRHAVEKSRHNLIRHERRLIGYLADGSTLDPARIVPRLVEVQRHSEQELLFRYARLHWSVPTSAGYARRLRFLVIDQSNGKLIGLIGLGDAVYSLTPRDEWIGWDLEQRKIALRGIMDAHILGAVPPYSALLGGKLVALLATSVELAHNSKAFLRGEDAQLDPHRETVADFSAFWRERWLLPRAARDRRYEDFQPGSWQLWSHVPKRRGRPPKHRPELSRRPEGG